MSAPEALCPASGRLRATDAEKASLAADIFRTITIYPGAADSEAAWDDPIVP